MVVYVSFTIIVKRNVDIENSAVNVRGFCKSLSQ